MADTADTARLLASLTLQDKFSGPASAINKSLSGLENKGSLLSRGFGLIGQGASFVGGAFNHLKGRIGSLLSGPLGMLGLGAGLFSIGGLFTSGISQARDFALEVGRLAKITGLSTEATSRLSGAFHHFGIETDTVLTLAGMAEKNLFKLGGTTKAAKAFQDKYGFSLRDSSGNLKDFNELVLSSADFFNNKQIPAATKAAALAAIYGRNWQQLIPILGAGRVAISDAEDEADRLGLKLNKDNLGALTRLKKATQDWGSALGGLKLQLGLAIVPLLTKVTEGATHFLATADEFGQTGTQKIVGFFNDVIGVGEKAFSIITNQFVPVVKQVIDGWNKLPAPLRGLLVKGAAGNFAVKFLLGFSPIGLAEQAAGVVAGKIAGVVATSLAKAGGSFIGDLLGKTAAQKLIPQAIIPAEGALPVFVTNPGFGLPGGGPGGLLGGAEAAAGGAGLVVALSAATIAALGVAFIASQQVPRDPFLEPGGHIAPGRGFGRPSDHGRAVVDANTGALKDNTAALKGNTGPLKDFTGQLHGAPGGGHPAAAQIRLTDAQLIARLAKTSEFGFAGIGTKIEHGPLTGTDPFGQQALALFRQAEFPRQGKTLGEIQRHIIAAEEVQKQYLAKGDAQGAAQIQATIDGLRALLRGTDKVYHITQAEAGNRAATANRLNRLLDPLPGGIARLAAKDFSPRVQVTVKSTTQITVSNVARTLTSYLISSGKVADIGY